jgi:CheY-like chemotaxis protein
MKNVLIVDNDLGFVYWLGEVLIDAGYQPWPACSVSDAITVVGRKPAIPLDLLIVNPSVRGASRLIDSYRRTQAQLKVMALGAHDEKVLPGVKAWREKPVPGDRSARQKWVRAIGRISSGQKRAA